MRPLLLHLNLLFIFSSFSYPSSASCSPPPRSFLSSTVLSFSLLTSTLVCSLPPYFTFPFFSLISLSFLLFYLIYSSPTPPATFCLSFTRQFPTPLSLLFVHLFSKPHYNFAYRFLLGFILQFIHGYCNCLIPEDNYFLISQSSSPLYLHFLCVVQLSFSRILFHLYSFSVYAINKTHCFCIHFLFYLLIHSVVHYSVTFFDMFSMKTNPTLDFIIIFTSSLPTKDYT